MLALHKALAHASKHRIPVQLPPIHRMPVRNDRVHKRGRFRTRQQQHLTRLHFQDLIGGHEFLALLGGRGLAALAELGG